MISFKNSGRLCEHVSELPQLVGVKRLYLDVEATSFDPHEYGNSPWHGHRICGVAVTADDIAGAWYVPIRHYMLSGEWHPANLPLEPVQRWLSDVVSTAEEWINHEVRFDAHMCAADGARFTGKLSCTLTRAKLLDTDRGYRGGYGLDKLSDDELDEDISEHERRVQGYLASLPSRNRKKLKDYGLVPPDIMGEYACQDVITNRQLHLKQLADRDHVVANKLERFANIWDIESRLTPVLFDVEEVGLRVDPQMLAVKELTILTEVNLLQERIKALTDMNMEPWNSNDCYELLCSRWGLPVIAWTNDKDPSKPANPSFDADALTEYLSHPLVASNEKYTRIVKIMQRARDQHTLWTFFVKPFKARAVQDSRGFWRIYPRYNQLVRTGRMSAKEKVQQMSEEAKELILPDPGCAFLSCDASQIEFRLIGHYAQIKRVLDAYRENPDADFHQLVAGWCEIHRKPAKNVNFMLGYGGGERKTVTMLSRQEELVKSLMKEAEVVVATPERRENAIEFFSRQKVTVEDDDHLRKLVFDHYCKMRADEVYHKYHEMMPEIKPTMAEAEQAAKRRKFVFTEHGRMRHFPKEWEILKRVAWRAFNTITQGSAADVQKEVTIEMSPRNNKWMRDLGIALNAQVHDENLYHGPIDATRDPATRLRIVSGLEATRVKFDVPIRFGCGWSDVNWRVACGDKAPHNGKVPRETFDPAYAAAKAARDAASKA